MAGDIYDYSRVGLLSIASDGVSVSPPYCFSSETSLGFYRSANSTIAMSYGTVVFSQISSTGTIKSGPQVTGAQTIQASGYTGTPLQAFSATSFLGVAMVVQGSASSFSIFVWPAARNGDAITVTPGNNAGVSSLSSGLVLHSHCTQNGQVEVRWSNVSTLVQNQSGVSYNIYRWSAF